MAAQSLASLLVHAGFEKVDAKLQERNLRFSLLYESLLENKNLIQRIAVKIIALVLDHDTPRASRHSASQLQVPKDEHLGLPEMIIKESMFGDSSLMSASAHSEVPPVTTVAQQAILAIHVRYMASLLSTASGTFAYHMRNLMTFLADFLTLLQSCLAHCGVRKCLGKTFYVKSFRRLEANGETPCF